MAWAWALPVVMTVAVGRAATLDEIEATIAGKWESISTLTADMSMKMNLSSPSPLESKGSFEFFHDNGVDKKRMEMSISFDVGGAAQTFSQSVIFDGESIWTIRDHLGKQMVAKDRPDVMEGTPGGKYTFEQLRRSYDMTVLPDETLDGKAAFAIEAKPKEKRAGGIAKYLLYFGKENGMMIQTAGFDELGEKVTIITFSNVKINPELDAARFEFKGGDNTAILDRTKKSGD